jgi:hypothetical protein
MGTWNAASRPQNGMQLFLDNLKMKIKKGQNFFDLWEWGFEPEIFCNFPARNLNFHGR